MKGNSIAITNFLEQLVNAPEIVFWCSSNLLRLQNVHPAVQRIVLAAKVESAGLSTDA